MRTKKRGKGVLIFFVVLIYLAFFLIAQVSAAGQWVYDKANRGKYGCEDLCKTVGEKPTSDANKNVCRSAENDPNSGIDGGSIIEHIKGSGMFGESYWCWRSGQNKDYSNTDKVWACYCTKPTAQTCTPKTCSNYAGQCGSSLDNGCGGTIDCSNNCPSGKTCQNNICVETSPTPTPPSPQCSDEQTIMKIFSTTNSHGALWNDVSYNERVCYNEFFGVDYNQPNSHECTENNKVLRLSSSANAHAEIPERSSYLASVCYGNLVCRSVDASAGESCDSSEKIIASLSSKTNAHIAEGNYPQYPIKICCSSKITDISGAFWADMNDQPVTNSDKNDLVKLVVTGVELQETLINYTIVEVDGGFWFFDKEVSKISSKGGLVWRAGKKSDGSLAGGKYYFIARFGSKEFDSRKKSDDTDNPFGILEVSNNEINTPPVAKISSPIDRQIYFLGEQLNISQKSYDLDDGFDYTWDFGNGETLEGNSLNLSDFNYSYIGESGLGQKNIKLLITDERGASVRDQISILVVNSSYVLAYIDNPKYGETYGRSVDFDARGSYAVSVDVLEDECTRKITCLAGNCPQQAAGCPPCYASKGLNCPVSVDGSPNPYDDLNFIWIFDNNLNDVFSKKGLEGAVFTKVFPNIGRHIATLTVGLNPESSINTEFNVFYDRAVCLVVNNENQAAFPGLETGKSYWKSFSSFPTASFNNCYDPLGIDASGESKTECCPLGYSCNINSGQCYPQAADSCEDFVTEEECLDHDENDQIAFSQLNPIVEANFSRGCYYNEVYGDQCTQYVSCKCEWGNLGDETSPSCHAVSRHKVSDLDATESWDIDNLPNDIENICNAQEPPQIGECVFSFSYEGSCEEGAEFIRRTWRAEYTGSPGATNPDYCTEGSDVIPCAQVVRFPFFNIFNMIITIITIAFIYFILIKKKKLK